jgi:hypothetical protein
MRKTFPSLFIVLSVLCACTTDRYRFNLPEINAENLKFPPDLYDDKPGLPSPVLSEAGRELVLVKTDNDRYTWFDVTVENGEPFDYKKRFYGKGNQLLSDAESFPSLARRGLHSDRELLQTKVITGRSVSQITVDGRPWGSSGVGFMAEDETILSVIRADNSTVKSLGLTHPDLARPLFHLWNISRESEKLGTDPVTGNWVHVAAMIYNGYEVKIKIAGGRGWQESIFNDEILGTGHIEIWRELDPEEMAFLSEHYQDLSPDQIAALQKALSLIRTGEMVFFYINRYGFYEGHTEYRVDPLAVALVFGLRSVDDVHRASGGDLYSYFNSHFTENPD